LVSSQSFSLEFGPLIFLAFDFHEDSQNLVENWLCDQIESRKNWLTQPRGEDQG